MCLVPLPQRALTSDPNLVYIDNLTGMRTDELVEASRDREAWRELCGGVCVQCVDPQTTDYNLLGAGNSRNPLTAPRSAPNPTRGCPLHKFFFGLASFPQSGENTAARGLVGVHCLGCVEMIIMVDWSVSYTHLTLPTILRV